MLIYLLHIKRGHYILYLQDKYVPEVLYVRRGKKYAYASASVYQPGGKYPNAVNECLGVLDEETGKIIPKKNGGSADKILDDDSLIGRRSGGSYVLLNIAERIGLRGDLFGSYGPAGEQALACAVSQAPSGGPLSSTEDTVDGCPIRELQGVRAGFDSPRMSELAKTMGGSFGCLEEPFESRSKRTNDALSYDIMSASTNGCIKGRAEWGHDRDNEKTRQMNIGLVTDKRGVPAMFEPYPGLHGGREDAGTHSGTRTRAEGGDCTLMMDRGFGSADNLKYMLENGPSSVMPGKKGTKCVKSLMSMLVKEKRHADSPMVHGKRAYSVFESKVAIVPKQRNCGPDGPENNDTAGYELVLPDDERFSKAFPER